jgi:hypothetical protein
VGPICGKKIGYGKRAIAEFLGGVGRIIFYVSIAALIVSSFTPGGFGFVLNLCLRTCALLFILRTKSDTARLPLPEAVRSSPCFPTRGRC